MVSLYDHKFVVRIHAINVECTFVFFKRDGFVEVVLNVTDYSQTTNE